MGDYLKSQIRAKKAKIFNTEKTERIEHIKLKVVFPALALSVCSVFSVLIFLGCGLSAL